MLSVVPVIVALVLLDVSVKVLVPVSNLGVDGNVASGIKRDPIIAPVLSAISLIFVILATAPLEAPVRVIPTIILP